MVEQGFQVALVATALAISRSRLDYSRKARRGSRADQRWVKDVVAACWAKPTSGNRRVTWGLRRKELLMGNRKRVLGERGLLV